MSCLIRIFVLFLLGCWVFFAGGGEAKAAQDIGGRVGEDALVAALAGEFAMQSGQMEAAAGWYVQALEGELNNVGLAGRATRLAILAGDREKAQFALNQWRKVAPDDVSMHGAAALVAIADGDYRQGERELMWLAGRDEQEAWGYVLVGLSAGVNEPGLVVRMVRGLVSKGAIPRRLDAWQDLGRLALQLDERELAREVVGEMVRRFPDEPKVALLRASELQQSGKLVEAQQLLRGIESEVDGDVELRELLASAYMGISDGVSAVRVMAMGPQNVHTYEVRAAMLARGKGKVGLGALYDEVKAGGEVFDSQQQLLLGKLAEYLQNYDEAVVWYRQVGVGELQGEARLRMGNVLYLAGQEDEAFTQLQVLQEDVQLGREGHIEAYLLEAELHRQDGDVEEEQGVYRRGLAAYPDDGVLLYSRALVWERVDEVDRAEADLRKVLVSDPENIAALNALGYTLADRTSRYGEALELIERARAAAPESPAILDSYGWVLYRLGRNEEALVQLKKAWVLMKDAEVAAHVAEVLWVMGRGDEAREYLDEALVLDKDNRSVIRVLEKMGQ